MSVATLIKRADRLRERLARQLPTENPTLAAIRRDPANPMALAGLTPDRWQAGLLRSRSRRISLLCSRQAGKTLVGACLALKHALLTPNSLVLLLSPSIRQSQEAFRKATDIYRALGRPVATEMLSALRLELVNNSRIIALPGTEQTVRGFSGAALLIIDEGARVADALNYAVRPMLATSGGQLVTLSTPFGKLGWFYSAFTGTETWERVRITAREVPRIPREFLQDEERSLGPRWFAQEYMCEFSDAIGAVFLEADIQAALNADIQPLFGV
jgi:Terminase large subunit, T4likevirus-type, N-terminal